MPLLTTSRGARLALPLALLLLASACHHRHTASPSSESAPAPRRHPWPMTHHDAQRSGGSMSLPFMERKPNHINQVRINGQLARFNAPVLTDTKLACIGSVGLTPEAPDPQDGLHCIDWQRGELALFFHTASDAHGVSLFDDLALVGTQGGELIAVSLSDGSERWRFQSGGALTASPLVHTSPTGEDTVLVADHRGVLTALAPRTGQVRWQQQLDGEVWAGLAARRDLVVAATTEGEITAHDVASGTLRWRHQLEYLPETSDNLDQVAPRRARVEAAPVIAEDRVVIAFMRQNATQSSPPVAALSLETGELVWEASAKTTTPTRWHDQRTSPVFVEDRMIFFDAPGEHLGGSNLEDGALLFYAQGLGCVTAQHASMVHASDLSYAPRQDGYLYLFSQGYGLALWRLPLAYMAGHSAEEAEALEREARASYEEARACLESPPNVVVSGFLTTPAIGTGGEVILGHQSGVMFVISP